MGTRYGSQFPGLCWSRSSLSCQAQISHSISGHTVRVKLRHCSNQPHSLSALCVSQALAHNSNQPFSLRLTAPLATQSLGAHSSNHPQVSQPLLKCSSRSSCPLFLTSARLFTQPNFPTSPETIPVRVQHGPTPPFSRCRLAP